MAAKAPHYEFMVGSATPVAEQARRDGGAQQLSPAGVSLRQRSRLSRWLRSPLPGGAGGGPPVWSGILFASAAFALVGAPLADEDSLTDLLRSARATGEFAGTLRWFLLFPLILCAVLHFVCAAVALQASAGCRTPFGQRFLGQLAASTANRVTPAGLGGAAVNVRFLSVRGARSTGAAVGAVTALALFGALADMVVFTALLALSIWTRWGASSGELPALRRRVAEVAAAGPVGPAQVVAIVAVAALLVVVAFRRRPDSERAGRAWAGGARAAWSQLRDILHRPHDLLVLLTASAATTLLMGVGLATAVRAVPGALPGAPFGALIIAYMVGSAVGSALPTPAGIGGTEAGLVAALSLASVPVGHAVQSVLLFRIVAFWAPAVCGVAAARRLRVLGAL